MHTCVFGFMRTEKLGLEETADYLGHCLGIRKKGLDPSFVQYVQRASAGESYVITAGSSVLSRHSWIPAGRYAYPYLLDPEGPRGGWLRKRHSDGRPRAGLLLCRHFHTYAKRTGVLHTKKRVMHLI